MSEHQASQAARRSALSGPSSNTRSRSMSQLSEGILGQHEEEAEDFITPLENLEKEKQPENRAEAAANKTSDKGLDFSHHPAVIEMSEENRPASLKVGDLREFKRTIRDTMEGEKWYRLLSAIIEHDQAFLAQNSSVQKKALDYKNRSKKLITELRNAEEN